MSPLHRLIAYFAPDDCLTCGEEGALLCAACREVELAPMPSACYRCGKRTLDFATCRACCNETRLSAIYVATLYSGAARQLVLATKFDPRRGGAWDMSEVLYESFPEIAADIVTHCPTSSDRVRTRGFDQAAALGKYYARQTKLPYAPLLVRRHNLHQVGASRAERIRHARQSYEAKNAYMLANKHVLIVDDVYTTGATLTAAAALLKKAGAKRVSAIVFAH